MTKEREKYRSPEYFVQFSRIERQMFPLLEQLKKEQPYTESSSWPIYLWGILSVGCIITLWTTPVAVLEDDFFPFPKGTALAELAVDFGI